MHTDHQRDRNLSCCNVPSTERVLTSVTIEGKAKSVFSRDDILCAFGLPTPNSAEYPNLRAPQSANSFPEEMEHSASIHSSQSSVSHHAVAMTTSQSIVAPSRLSFSQVSAAGACLTTPNAIIFGNANKPVTPLAPTDQDSRPLSRAVDEILSCIPSSNPTDPISAIARAMSLMASALDNASFGAIRDDLSSIRTDIAEMRANAHGTETRVEAVESQIAQLSSLVQSSAADAQSARESAARAASIAQHCEPLDLVFSGLPKHDSSQSPAAIKAIGAAVGVNFNVQDVTSVRSRAIQTPSSQSASQNNLPNHVVLPAPADEASSRGPDLFVSFRSAELRSRLLERIRSRKGVDLALIDHNWRGHGLVKAFEVLNPERHATFIALRAEARKINARVWHTDGVFLCKRREGGRIRRINSVADLSPPD